MDVELETCDPVDWTEEPEVKKNWELFWSYLQSSKTVGPEWSEAKTMQA